jgi:hypothetical protein
MCDVVNIEAFISGTFSLMGPSRHEMLSPNVVERMNEVILVSTSGADVRFIYVALWSR